MNAISAQHSPCPKDIRVLVFTSGGMKLAVDTDQIVKLTGIEEAEGRGWDLFTVQDRLAPHSGAPTNPNAKVLMGGDERLPIAVLIDRLDEILSIPIDDLQPMPRLIALSGAARAVWSAVVRDGEIVLLVDLYKLPAGPNQAGTEPPAKNGFTANPKEGT